MKCNITIMRLYLSSYRLGKKPEELLKLVQSRQAKKKAAIIANAIDGSGDYRKIGLAEEVKDLGDLGFVADEVDLRQYFGKARDLEDVLADYDLIWVRGGNAFVLQRAIEQSGFNKIIKKFLAKDLVVYAGYSAGLVILTPTLKGIEIVDSPLEVPSGYGKEFSLDGMSILPYSVAPHYRSDHPESPAVEKLVEYFEKNKLPYKALSDGEAIVINGSHERIVR